MFVPFLTSCDSDHSGSDRVAVCLHSSIDLCHLPLYQFEFASLHRPRLVSTHESGSLTVALFFRTGELIVAFTVQTPTENHRLRW
jgi:hypothetical protein